MMVKRTKIPNSKNEINEKNSSLGNKEMIPSTSESDVFFLVQAAEKQIPETPITRSDDNGQRIRAPAAE